MAPYISNIGCVAHNLCNAPSDVRESALKMLFREQKCPFSSQAAPCPFSILGRTLPCVCLDDPAVICPHLRLLPAQLVLNSSGSRLVHPHMLPSNCPSYLLLGLLCRESRRAHSFTVESLSEYHRTIYLVAIPL